LLLYFVIPVKVEPTLGYVFVGGFLGVCAMFLPGISGAFALLILGLYDFMINVLQDIVNNFAYFIVFMLGAVLGAFAISRAISFLFRIDRCKTLYFLLGLVIGSLSIPVKRIAMISSLEITNILTMSFFFLIGVLAVLSLEYYRKKYEKKLQEIEDSIAIQLVR
jgi:putative membrane protein